ncbi:MAG: endonuclease/exonuclease/phosphatase family protein [Gammaproteobacteria bacterium]|nr:endonuclease/exonuclease/phosphatase family protein [Gammaproteobacteria bacterium]
MSEQIKVVTYNIHKGFSVGNRRFVLHGIREALNKSAADLLFLQETQGEHSRRAHRHVDWPRQSQYEFIADQNWPHHAYGRNAIYDAGHHGNAILSRFPFIEWENINVSTMARASRSVLHGVVRLSAATRPLHVVCIHFGLFASERRRQVDVLCDRIDAHVPAHEPLIVAGDFNDWTGQANLELASRLGLTDVFDHLHGRNALSFPALWPVLPMDRIYFRALQPLQATQLHGAAWRRLSDHVPLMATFELGETWLS